MPRIDGRTADALRPIRCTRNFVTSAPASVLFEIGRTRVLCTVCVSNEVPPFLEGSGRGWVTAEYGMLPGSTPTRKPRERGGKVDGRSVEIQRLIGRALRAVIALDALGERTLQVDCDVLEADGGTRCASVTGAWIAVADLCRRMVKEGACSRDPVLDSVAAVSAGVVDGEAVLDLCYAEDSRAEADVNVAMTGAGKFVEVQGTAEGAPFDRPVLLNVLNLAETGIRQLIELQRKALLHEQVTGGSGREAVK